MHQMPFYVDAKNGISNLKLFEVLLFLNSISVPELELSLQKVMRIEIQGNSYNPNKCHS